MTKKITNILFVLICNATYGQNFLNGDFEINIAGGNRINLSNVVFDSLMSNCKAFGTNGNMDIVTTAIYSGGPQSGNWYVALTGGGTDVLSLRINAPLSSGNSYTISFYDKSHTSFVSSPIEIGLSTSNTSFGALIYTASSSAAKSTWTQRTFTFVAPNNGQFLTVRQQGVQNNWVQVDNFSFNCTIDLSLGNDTTLCQGQTITLNGGSATSYLWSSGSASSSINISASGTYWLEVSNGQCSDRDSINISFNPAPLVDLGNDTTLCQGQTVILSGGFATSYLWSNASASSSINISASGTYWLEASNGQCSGRDSINISFNPAPLVDLGNDTTLCQGQTMTLNGGSATSYLWSNGSTSSSINVSTSGTYWLEVSNGQCSDRDSINISFNPAPLVDLGNDTTLCQGQTITLNGGSATSYLWSNGSKSSSINISASGTFWLEVSNGQCSGRDSMNISFNPAPLVNLGNDTTLCQGQTITLNGDSATSYLWSNGSTSSSINVSTSGTYWLEVSNGQCSERDSINISFNSTPFLNLGNDTTLCEGKTITLNGGSATSYLWSNGSTSSSINISTSGTYWLEVRNNCAINSDTIDINFNRCDCYIYIPNAFTPNRDNLNDNFSSKSNCIFVAYNLKIFNRWGERIFETNSSIEPWDGTYRGEIVPEGVYVYLVTYVFENETRKSKFGTITLIR